MRLTLTGSWDIDVCGKATVLTPALQQQLLLQVTVQNPALQQRLPSQATVQNPALQQNLLLQVTVQNPALLQNSQSKRLCRIQRYLQSTHVSAVLNPVLMISLYPLLSARLTLGSWNRGREIRGEGTARGRPPQQ